MQAKPIPEDDPVTMAVFPISGLFSRVVSLQVAIMINSTASARSRNQ